MPWKSLVALAIIVGCAMYIAVSPLWDELDEDTEFLGELEYLQ